MERHFTYFEFLEDAVNEAELLAHASAVTLVGQNDPLQVLKAFASAGVLVEPQGEADRFMAARIPSLLGEARYQGAGSLELLNIMTNALDLHDKETAIGGQLLKAFSGVLATAKNEATSPDDAFVTLAGLREAVRGAASSSNAKLSDLALNEARSLGIKTSGVGAPSRTAECS